MTLLLTPALSPSEEERENRRQSVVETDMFEIHRRRNLLFPLPLGGGEGQGEGAILIGRHLPTCFLT